MKRRFAFLPSQGRWPHAHTMASRLAIRLTKQPRQPREVHRHPPGLVLEQHPGMTRGLRMIPEIGPSDGLPASVLHPKRFGALDHMPWWREAASCRRPGTRR
jgi:hypothetical protein